jgi:hypothetical protein
MNQSPEICLFIGFLLAAAGCEKKEPVLLSGDIAGMVTVYDENYLPLQDMSGVLVSLLADTAVVLTETGPSGEFWFHDIECGNYRVELEMEGFIKPDGDYTLHHLGGYSPTLAEYRLHEIPKFETVIDSIQFNGMYETSYIYVTLHDISQWSGYGYLFRCFFSNTPQVSGENYVSTDAGWLLAYPEDTVTRIRVVIYDSGFGLLGSDTAYACVYPQAWGWEGYHYHPGSLGEPSNVFPFLP